MNKNDKLETVSDEALYNECRTRLPLIKPTNIYSATLSCLWYVIFKDRSFKLAINDASEKFKCAKSSIEKHSRAALPDDYLLQKRDAYYAQHCVDHYMVDKMEKDNNQHIASIVQEQSPIQGLPTVEAYSVDQINQESRTSETIMTTQTETTRIDNLITHEAALKNFEDEHVVVSPVSKKTQRKSLACVMSSPYGNNPRFSQTIREEHAEVLGELQGVELLDKLVVLVKETNTASNFKLDKRAELVLGRYLQIRLLDGLNGSNIILENQLLNIATNLYSFTTQEADDVKSDKHVASLCALQELILVNPKDPLTALFENVSATFKCPKELPTILGVPKVTRSELKNLVKAIHKIPLYPETPSRYMKKRNDAKNLANSTGSANSTALAKNTIVVSAALVDKALVSADKQSNAIETTETDKLVKDTKEATRNSVKSAEQSLKAHLVALDITSIQKHDEIAAIVLETCVVNAELLIDKTRTRAFACFTRYNEKYITEKAECQAAGEDEAHTRKELVNRLQVKFDQTTDLIESYKVKALQKINSCFDMYRAKKENAGRDQKILDAIYAVAADMTKKENGSLAIELEQERSKRIVSDKLCKELQAKLRTISLAASEVTPVQSHNQSANQLNS
jgi:hypothetical protein